MEWNATAKIAVAAAGAVAVLAVALVVATAGPEYGRSEATAADPEVREALQILRSAAKDPGQAGQFLATDASRRGRAAALSAVADLKGATAISLEEAVWFGDYLRVTVAHAAADERAGRATLMFRREGGDLVLTGAGQ